MIRSMTGYSRVEAEEAGIALTVSIRGTNHRFLDPQLRLPSSLEALEPVVRRLVKEHVTRGHVEISVGLTGLGPPELEIDRRLLAAYLKGYQMLKQEFGAGAEPDLMALLRVPGLVVTGNGDMPPEDLDRIRQMLETAMAKALTQLNEMRAREGESLERDILSRLAHLAALRLTVANLAERAPQYYKQRLEGRIRDLSGSVEMDSGRLAQEVAYLASRSDIAEELTRFQSHLDQVRQLLAETSEVGKKLDFLLQEMNREANTLLSKTTDVPEVGLEITRQAIEMKTEIEKLREQALNIE
ncbi:MAG TPA: YicC/YloC family endoribonuclease [Terriglobia bacterium]|nr:YicC/YloC family endoribonuclease [Terriglobia bacterium]